ncbi:MAG: single-stranded DNA-binding protein [Nocardioidaceae bacterium]
MNDTQITIRGWVGSDVTLTDVGNGVQVASFRVGSTPRRLRNGSWEDGPTAWYTVKAWRGLAQHVADSVRVREPVIVQGRLEADVWEKSDGSTSVRFVVVASAVGHDLGFGTTSFAKDVRRPTSDAEDGRLREVIHSYAEAGPRLDSFGDPVGPPSTVEPDPRGEVDDPAA